MLSKLFWFALGAGAMRYMMNRGSGSLPTGGTGLARYSGSSSSGAGSGTAGGSAGSGQGLQQSALSGGSDAGMSGSMMPDEGQDAALQPASTGTGLQGARSTSGEQGAEKAYS